MFERDVHTFFLQPLLCALRHDCCALYHAPLARSVMRASPASPARRTRNAQLCRRGDLLVLFPGEPVIADVCVTHPLASSYMQAASSTDGYAAGKAEEAKRLKYGRTGTGGCGFVPLAHETFGRAGPAAFAFLNKIADAASASGAVSRRVFLHHAMRDLSTTLCRGVASQVRACAPVMARMVGKPVLAGLAVPTDDLVPLTGHDCVA